MSMAQKFQTFLFRPEGVGTWTYADIPAEVSKSFGSRGQIKVKGTIEGVPFRSTLMAGGDGAHFLVVNAAVREKCGKAAGDAVQVELEQDCEPREVEIPDDFQSALALNEVASDNFERLSNSHKKRYVDHINEAKAVDTRMRRIDRTVETLQEGKPRQ